jgi:MoxR-like ATPase
MVTSLDLIRRLEENVSRALVGKPEAVRLAVVGLIARGHLLIEDVPGVGKTTLAAALARSIGGGFQRIQFTSDMLPSDVLGVSVWEPKLSEFVFKPGPLFTNIVLADEINRTTPKTQSSLLEAMNEAQVSLDHSTYPLPQPFMVLATQNPREWGHVSRPVPARPLPLPHSHRVSRRRRSAAWRLAPSPARLGGPVDRQVLPTQDATDR